MVNFKIASGGSKINPNKTQTLRGGGATPSITRDPMTVRDSTGTYATPGLQNTPSVSGLISKNTSGGGSSGGGGGVAPMAAPAPVSEEDYLAGDSAYQAQIAALARALQDFQADDTAKRTQYNTDFGTTLKNLGYNEGTKAWATGDTNTAAGRSYQNQLNDFAGRGLLQSSLYGTAVDNLMRSLNDQLSGINTAKTNFLSDQDRALSQYKNQNTLDSQQARAEALARRAAGLSLA